jgi:hypothetical protein
MDAQSAPPADDGPGDATGKIARQSIQMQYLSVTLQAVRSFDWVLTNLQGVTDRRPKYICRQIINRVLDDEIRHAMLREFDKKLAEINASQKTNEQKSDEIIQLSIDSTGEAIAYLDEFLNIHKQNVVGDA